MKREEQEGGRKGPEREQYSRRQLTGQTRLLLSAGRVKDWRDPANCFFRRREREKETDAWEKETDKLTMDASSAVRIKVAKARTVTSLRDSWVRSRD